MILDDHYSNTIDLHSTVDVQKANDSLCTFSDFT